MYDSDISVRLVHEDDIGRLEPIWDSFVKARNDLSAFSSFAWHKSWWQSVGSHRTDLKFGWIEVVNSGNGNTIGVIPLMYVRQDGQKWIVSHSSPFADYFDIICKSGDELRCSSALLRYLRQKDTHYKRLEFHCLRADSLTALALQNCIPFRSLLTSNGPPCPVLDFGCEVSFKRAVTKRTTERKKRQLKRLGKVEFGQIFEKSKIMAHFERFAQWHEQRWSRHPKAIGLFSDSEVKRFFLMLVNTMTNQRQLMFSTLSLDEIPIAMFWGFLSARGYEYYRSAFNPSFEQFSPGAILLDYLIRFCAKSNLQLFDFLRGNYRFKYRYANREIAMVNFTIFLPSK
jgi:CelD/BcsL family acetyltransferase involved in cellulose biosynthesis